MIKNYFKTAWRNLQKNKATSIINIVGLAIGIGASLIIFMIVRYDSSFDKWQPSNKNVYRLYTYSGPDDINSGVTTALPQAIKDNVTGVDVVSHFLSLVGNRIALVESKNNAMKAFANNEGVIFTDADFFSIFPHRWIVGNPKTSLGVPNTVVLSRSSAETFFPKQNLSNIIGKRIVFGDNTSVTVSGIVDDLEEHSDFDFKIFISYPTIISNEGLKKIYRWGHWGHVDYYSNCVVRLKDGANSSSVEKQLKDLDFVNNKPDPGMHGDEPKLLSISDNHFATDIDGSISKATLFGLEMIALFILSLAVINYVNLSTAQSSLRAKEVGVRKTFGGNERQIKLQFLIETFAVTLLSALLAIILIPVLMKGFSNYIPKDFTFINVLNSTGIICLAILVFALAIIAGIYPALILARFEPVKILKSSTSGKGYKNSFTRKVLIISQFAVAQILLVLVITVSRQIHYSIHKDLGYKNVKGIISFYIPDAKKYSNSNKYALINKIKQIAGVVSVSLSSASPTSASQSVSIASAIVKGHPLNFSVWTISGDTSYINLFGISLVAGSNITTDTSSNLKAVLVNETFVNQIGYDRPQSAINNVFDYDGNKTIIKGVLHDFNINSVKSFIKPMIYYYDKDYASNVNVLLSGAPMDWQSSIQRIQLVYHQIYPNNSFDYAFLDKSIEKLYKEDIAISQALTWATGLAIFISCLGLFGLVTFMANQRRKEIGIRKVLGASVYQIIGMLSKSMLELVVTASLIAFPVAWYFSRRWLQDFAYKVNVGWWGFIISAVAMMVLALCVLGVRAWKSARENPVKSLKTE
ncbi:MAG TPA: FtsX-like permease family protein [Arachidicoccus sp.]